MAHEEFSQSTCFRAFSPFFLSDCYSYANAPLESPQIFFRVNIVNINSY